MFESQTQFDGPQPKSRWFRLTRPKLLIRALLIAASGIGLAVWNLGLPPSWSADYDREMYTQIRSAIAADKQHFLGRSFEEFSEQLDLKCIPWDDASVQNAGQYRIYHFRGFALHVNVDLQRPTDSPVESRPYTGQELRSHGVLQVAHRIPVVKIDGINDRHERMKQFWKVMTEECERINAKLERSGQQSQK